MDKENITISTSTLNLDPLYKTLDLSSSMVNKGITSGVSFGSNNLTVNPGNNNITISTTNDSSISNQIDPKEVAELKLGVKNIIQNLSEGDKIEDKAIRKAADELNIYWKTLEKFINDESISKSVQLKLVNALKAVTISSNHHQKNIVDLVKQISNENVDAVVVDYWYNPTSHISQYKDDLKDGINYINKKWKDYWTEYSTDPIKAIDLIDKHENDSIFHELELRRIKFYFAILPKYMHRIAGKKVKSESVMGIFYVVVGWEDFIDLDNLKIALDEKGNNTIDISKLDPEFPVTPNFKNLILKEDFLDE